jgi:hypothetical protein
VARGDDTPESDVDPLVDVTDHPVIAPDIFWPVARIARHGAGRERQIDFKIRAAAGASSVSEAGATARV